MGGLKRENHQGKNEEDRSPSIELLRQRESRPSVREMKMERALAKERKRETDRRQGGGDRVATRGDGMGSFPIRRVRKKGTN